MACERTQVSTLLDRLEEAPERLIVVTGLRQTGKTTLVRQALDRAGLPYRYLRPWTSPSRSPSLPFPATAKTRSHSRTAPPFRSPARRTRDGWGGSGTEPGRTPSEPLRETRGGSLRVLTHPRVFHPPTPVEAATTFVDALLAQPATVALRPGGGHWRIFRSMSATLRLTGNRVPDAYHAALAIEHGCE